MSDGPNSTSASGNHAAIVSPSSIARPAMTLVWTSSIKLKARSREATDCTCRSERSNRRNIFSPLIRWMIVTTCGAAGTLPALVFTEGGAGFFGDGAGVCATAATQKSITPTNVVTCINFRTVIFKYFLSMPVYQSRFEAY